MHRMQMDPRQAWQRSMENELDFLYHCLPAEHEWKMEAYWQEKAFYVFNRHQIEQIHTAAEFCYDYYCNMLDVVIDKDQWDKLGIKEPWVGHIKNSWDKDDPSMIGRFDFSYDGINPPKLLEFNADTPTSLYEASIVQWHAKESRFGTNYDQYNSIHETLLSAWKDMKVTYGVNGCHFTSWPNAEDITNAVYSMKVAQEAGIEASYLPISDIGYDPNRSELYGLNNETINNIYKLWPFEYWIDDNPYILNDVLKTTRFIEPIWKMGMSTKAALPLIYQNNKNSEFLLPAYYAEDEANKNLKLGYAKKPFYSREGDGVTLIEKGEMIDESYSDLEYDNFIYQKLAKLPTFKDTRTSKAYSTVIGVWVIGGEVAGMGIRENEGLITNNNSLFVPHIFVENEADINSLKTKYNFSQKLAT